MAPDNRNEKRIGLAFPLRLEDGENGGSLMACTDGEHIKQSIRTLLLTASGERVMRPDFGSRAGAYLFESIGATTATLIKHEIRTSVERYEPRVELTDIQVSGDMHDPGVLRIAIGYRILSTGAADNLTMDLGR